MIGSILEFDDLKNLCRPRSPHEARLSTVERWLKKQAIPYKKDDQGGVWTTIEAVNSSLGITSAKPKVADLEGWDI